jgi:hypothetical protein
MREKIIEENKVLIPLGLRTINEGRMLLGDSPVPGGDNAIYQSGGTMLKVKDLDKETEDVNSLNVSQPSNNQGDNSKKVVPIKEEKKKTAADFKNIFENKKKRFLSGYIAEFFKKNGNPDRIVEEVKNYFYQNLGIETELIKNVINAVLRYEKLKNAKNNHEERLNLAKELIKAYDITLYDATKGMK